MASARSGLRDVLFSSAVVPRPPPSFVDVVDGRASNISDGDFVSEIGNIEVLFVFESRRYSVRSFQFDKNGGRERLNKQDYHVR
jgi:hypothetical protein